MAVALDVSPALVFYHFGTKDDLVAEAFAHAVEHDLHRLEKAAYGDDPVASLRRVLRLYGPTGRATGWRIWIDAWAVALRDPHIRKVLQRLDRQWQDILRGVVDDGVASGSSPARIRRRRWPASPRWSTGSPSPVVHRSVTREQLRGWVAAQLAVELGVDVETLD